MILLSSLELSLPFTNPVLIFSLILFVILFAPILLNKLKIPHLIGLIIAGAIIGPYGLNLMMRDSSIVLFGTVGLLYIMFLAGLEIDLGDFKKNSGKSIVFGLYTFLIPMILGTLGGYYLLNFSVLASVLLASMFASHTLIAYPIISRLGITKNKAVNITIAGTMITDTLALLVLAVIVGMASGDIDNEFWVRLSISVIIFGLIVLLGFPLVSRWFFKRFDDNISQYIFVLGMVFLGAFLAEAAGIEAIIGAFLAGLALNRLVPRTSPLMNRIEFVGNALFIPFFLIGVGMLIDYRAFIQDFETIKVAAFMTTIAMLAKFLAAYFTQKTFRFTIDERRVIFGLSNAQAAATLAAILVGYNVIIGETTDGEPIRLLNESVLNGTILMILITCTVASFVAQKGAQNIALLNASTEEPDDSEFTERILIPISNIDNTDELIHLSTCIKSPKNHKGLFALNVINNSKTNEAAEKYAKKILDKATKTAAATDNELHQLLRYDINIGNAITSVVKEHKITDIILGLHDKKDISDSFLGNLTEGILNKCSTTTLIYKSHQPLGTIKRTMVVVPENAEHETGFILWLIKIFNMSKNTGTSLIFFAGTNTITHLKDALEKYEIDAEYNDFLDWDDFLILSRDMKKNDNLVIVLSRKDNASYHNSMQKIPKYLNKYFQSNNFILVYPIQESVESESTANLKSPRALEPLEGRIAQFDELGRSISNIFKKRSRKE
ncbi:MAG: cation:proton antiporter [Cyclobacteriaceae bacterium]